MGYKQTQYELQCAKPPHGLIILTARISHIGRYINQLGDGRCKTFRECNCDNEDSTHDAACLRDSERRDQKRQTGT
jgi:hypothetical protein